MTLTEGVRERERDREIEIWIVTMGMRGWEAAVESV